MQFLITPCGVRKNAGYVDSKCSSFPLLCGPFQIRDDESLVRHPKGSQPLRPLQRHRQLLPLVFLQLAMLAQAQAPNSSAALEKAPTLPTGVMTMPASHAADAKLTVAIPDSKEVDGSSGSRESESLFDSPSKHFNAVLTTIEVRDTASDMDTGAPEPYRAGGEDVINSAGTFGDISRYLQLLPGVVATSDYSNQMLVRGGHPMENLFLVDDIEVPNINHFAVANTTGGAAPMIDAAAVQGLKIYTGGYDARYPERLSSVTAIQTLDSIPDGRRTEGDFGIQGLGGIEEQRLFGGDLLSSAHRGLLGLISNNVGINGVPSYTNELSRYRRIGPSGDRFSLLNLAGWDSISMTPCASDTAETSTIDTDYRGSRVTSGGEWQHVLGSHSFSVLSFSDSEQIEHISQKDQIASDPTDPSYPHVACPIPPGLVNAVPVYEEDSNNGFSSANYRYEWATAGIGLSTGGSAWLLRPHYIIAQPIGAFSPYSVDPMRSDSTSFSSDFSTGESGAYSQLVVHPGKALTLSAGGRMQSFAFGSHVTFTPRLSLGYRLGGSVSFHVAYARYALMPPFVNMLAYPVNRFMDPMRVTHEIVGFEVTPIRDSVIRIEGYRKSYNSIPASTEYPSVTLNTMTDMLASETVWLPMDSSGRGNASGIEVSDSSRFGSRLQLQFSAAYSRAKFAGLDGILRPSNFDLPWIVNAAGVERLGRGYLLSARYGYATGRPYTPFDLADSLIQNRPIYDLSSVNLDRSPYYARLDAQVNKEIKIGSAALELYGGMDNIFNRSNFLSYAWMPRYDLGTKQRDPVATFWQMPIFPNFGVRIILRDAHRDSRLN